MRSAHAWEGGEIMGIMRGLEIVRFMSAAHQHHILCKSPASMHADLPCIRPDIKSFQCSNHQYLSDLPLFLLPKILPILYSAAEILPSSSRSNADSTRLNSDVKIAIVNDLAKSSENVLQLQTARLMISTYGDLCLQLQWQVQMPNSVAINTATMHACARIIR